MDNRLFYRGVVKDNEDRTNLGRIRIEPEDWIISLEKEINDFDESKDMWKPLKDPFVFKPLLPNKIFMVPNVGDSVTIVYTDPDRPFIDGYYIPNSSPGWEYLDSSSYEHINSDSKQGLNYKKPNDLIDDNGRYKKVKFDGAIPKKEDFVISNYNSDIIFGKNEIVIRSGKLNEEITRREAQPVRDVMPAIIQVSKFDTTQEYVELDDEEVIVYDTSFVTTLVEYLVTNLNDSEDFNVVIYVYQAAKVKYKTEALNFGEGTVLESDEKKLLFTKEMVVNELSNVPFEVRNEIRKIMDSGEKGVDGLDGYIKHSSNVSPSSNVPMYPFYFRPEINFMNASTSGAQNIMTKYYNIINNIYVGPRKGYGLIFSKSQDDVPSKQVTQKKNDIVSSDSPSKNIKILSDTNYLLAYKNNIPTGEKGIDFNAVNNYKITQDELVKNIHNETYALVRGEKLLELLEVMKNYLTSHVHNPAEKPVVAPKISEDLKTLFSEFTQNILSTKNRIN